MASQNRPRRVRRSAAQWRHLIQEEARSGLAQRAFCARHGVAPSSLRLWKRKLGAEGELPSTQFIELTPDTAETAHGWDVELELGDGVRLRLRRG